ncbi:hypothetical protein [Halorubrum sp. BV1]|uniref:hypothetical protein n=1 Tax=Halorubrum sp. BV1 TaxID=1498500 RepID=UPI00067990B2|nr:hypothetical protein [Halorubrum sp. BV1]
MSDLDPTDGVGDESDVSDGSGVGDESDVGGWSDPERGRAITAAADEVDVDREEALKRAIVGLAESEGIAVPDADEVASIRSRIDELDADVDEKVADLRERFVELYRDLESKAPADHVHEETIDRLDSVEDDLDSIEGDLDDVTAEVGRHRADLDATQTDLIEVEGRLAEVEAEVGDLDVDAVEDKLSRVASAILRVRRRLETLEDERDDRQRLDALTTVANRHGIETAACSDCGETVRLGLLTTPECPHCGRAFVDVDPRTWFFRSSRLVVADPPALDGDVDADGADTPAGTGDDAGRTDGGGAEP